jgi:succinate dehydrogenase/fumarate reductase iron-sulfur protein
MSQSKRSEETRTLRIKRFKAQQIDPPRDLEYEVALDNVETVLDGLEKLRLTEEPGLLYRHSCHHASCGTCACLINGVERLACVTRFDELEEGTVTVEPLPGFAVEGDLVVDMAPLYRDLSEDWALLRPSEGAKKKPPPAGVDELRRLEDCIECGICVASCPVAGGDEPFMGPAALAAINRQLETHPEESEALLALAGSDRGQARCQRAIDCSRRCPSKVAPARHIAELRRRLTGE